MKDAVATPKPIVENARIGKYENATKVSTNSLIFFEKVQRDLPFSRLRRM